MPTTRQSPRVFKTGTVLKFSEYNTKGRFPISRIAFHIEKYKKGALRSIEKKHGLTGEQGESTGAVTLLFPPHGALHKSVFHRVAQRDDPERGIRRDAVLLCEAMLSGCDTLFSQMEKSELLRFFKSAAGFLQRRFFPENCMYALVYTGASPHMCFGFVPMTKENRLSAKQVLSISQLGALQTELPAHLAECGYNVEIQREPKPALPEDSTIKALRESVRALEQSKRELEQELKALAQQKELAAELLSLQRENQNLRLERIMLNRQIEGYVEVLSSNSELEQLFSTQLQLMKCMNNINKKTPAS